MVILMISFLVAVFCAELIVQALYAQAAMLMILSSLFIIRFPIFKRYTFYGVCLLIFLGVALGVWRYDFSRESERKDTVSEFDGVVEIVGEVVAEVDVRVDKVKYVLSVETLRKEGKNYDVIGRVLVTAARYPVYQFGDTLKAYGELARPEKIEDFAYDQYLAKERIYAVMYRANVEIVKEGGASMLRYLYQFKAEVERRIMQIWGEPAASFLAGLLLGSRKGIPVDLSEKFRVTGLTHLVAISGYNITLVILFAGGLLGWLGRRWRVIATIVFIVMFVLLVGASSSVIRAGIMGGVSLVALYFGRQYLCQLALLFSAFVMVFLNPLTLIYDTGFQLSFLATFGLIYFGENFKSFFGFLPERFALRESVAMTLSAQVAALPLLLFTFKAISLVSPLANVAVLPLIPLIMLGGFLAVVSSVLWGFLGEFFGFLTYLIVKLFILLVDFFSSLPFALLDLRISWWLMLLYYLVLGFYLLHRRKSG